MQLVCLVLSCYLYARVLSAALGLLFYSSDSMLHIDVENVIGTLFEHLKPCLVLLYLLCVHNLL